MQRSIEFSCRRAHRANLLQRVCCCGPVLGQTTVAVARWAGPSTCTSKSWPGLEIWPASSCGQDLPNLAVLLTIDCQKISTLDATRCQISRLKCTKLDYRWGPPQTPHGEFTAHSVTCHPAEVIFPPLPQPKLVLD